MRALGQDPDPGIASDGDEVDEDGSVKQNSMNSYIDDKQMVLLTKH